MGLGFFLSLISIKRPLQRISYSILKECQDLQKTKTITTLRRKKKDIHYNRHNIHIYKNKKKKKKVELNKFEKKEDISLKLYLKLFPDTSDKNIKKSTGQNNKRIQRVRFSDGFAPK